MNTILRTTALVALMIIPLAVSSAGAAEDDLSPREQLRSREINSSRSGNHGPGETSNSVGQIHGNVKVGGRIRQRVWVGGNIYSAGPHGRACNTVGSIGVRTRCR